MILLKRIKMVNTSIITPIDYDVYTDQFDENSRGKDGMDQ